jgi:cupin 2 domain-containing protein
MKNVGNLLQGLPDATQGEVFETLVRAGEVLIERIVSQGQASAPGLWYEQARAEWVVLLQGAARLEWEGGSLVTLEAGDQMLIPAGKRHRVDWTDQTLPTVWIAVHFPDET